VSQSLEVATRPTSDRRFASCQKHERTQRDVTRMAKQTDRSLMGSKGNATP
jgi:hypothetical protein